jgi:hypothetical protein
MIYQVRDPDESLVSFLRYKERNPTWNPHIGQDELPAHMWRIYESLLKCAIAYPGLIVEYAALEHDFERVMGRIFGYLWGEAWQDTPTNHQLIATIEDITGRDQRAAKQKTTFLGQSTTRLERDKDQYAAMFEHHAADIQACYAAYQSLLTLENTVK